MRSKRESCNLTAQINILLLGTSVLFPCEAESSRELCFLIKPVLHPRSLGMFPSNTSHRLPGKTQCFIIASANIDQHHLALSPPNQNKTPVCRIYILYLNAERCNMRTSRLRFSSPVLCGPVSTKCF